MGVQLLADDEPIPPVPNLPGLPALTMTPPPTEQLPSIMAAVENAVHAVPADQDAALVGNWSHSKGGLAALVVRAPHGWNVVGWVAAPKDQPIDYGFGVVKTWKF